MKTTICVEYSIEEYIDLLKERREEIGRDYNWTIPDGVWDGLIDSIRDGMDISDARPMFVVDNLAVNGDYCLFECSVYVNRIIAAARARERERGIARAMGKELVEYIMDNYKTLLDDCGVADEILFAYDDGDSKYGFGICSSL